MKKIDPRFLQDEGVEIFTGNELLVKGALETVGGVHLLTGYPGSPIANFFDTLSDLSPLLKEKGIVAQLANNEALSIAMVNGSQMVGCRSIAAFKSVGMHVASDALALGVLMGTPQGGGGLIICGDDPWCDSTQVPADSRFLAEHVRLPMVEPSSPQEVKDWVNLSFKLGRAGQIYIGYMMTVLLADGGGTVACYPNQYPVMNQHQKRSLDYLADIEPYIEETVLLPPRTGNREVGLADRFAAIKRAASELGINRIIDGPQKGEQVPMGFVASGGSYGYLQHALAEMGLAGRLPILKLGLTYPADEQIVTEFAQKCQQVIVIEERRSFVERQITEILSPLQQSGKLTTQVFGKRFPGNLPGIPSTRGLNPSLLIEKLVPLIKNHPTLPVELTNGRLTDLLSRITEPSTYQVNLPLRTPTFCPGCPHRDSSSVLLELREDLRDPHYMHEHHQRKPVELVCHGDTGCYTMLMFEPTKPLMNNYSGMGLGGATGSGIDPFIDNKQIVFMGDGTFFHSGQIAIGHSLALGQDITYIILDNGTTAMTGHQTNPGLEFDLTGDTNASQDIARIIAGMIPKQLVKDARLVRINPADRVRYRKLLEQTILAKGVKVVIADKECGITYYRTKRVEQNRLRKQFGYLPKATHMNVASEVCENCLECSTQTGCPGLTQVQTDYGPKIGTDFSWCVNDGACHRIHACPSFEELTIYRQAPPKQGDQRVDLTQLPDPAKPIHGDQDTWRCYLTGVGGMGVGLTTALLVAAGHQMGYHVQFLDKKGLAIRNGGVFSQIVYARRESQPAVGQAAASSATSSTTPVIPYGQADLLLGVDLLEAVRAIDPKLPYRTASKKTATVVNTALTPTILALMGKDKIDLGQMDKTLRQYVSREHYFGFNVGDLCERLLDSKLYANVMILGIAYQKGYLPLTWEVIEKAIGQIIKHETQRNLRAFNIGRFIAHRPDLFTVELKHDYESSRQALRRKLNTILATHSKKRGMQLAKQFRILAKQTFRATRGRHVEDRLIRDVVIRAYDCFVWGGMRYAKRYCHRVVDVFHQDDPKQDFRITWAVVWNLAKVMLIKDEIYVASLLTSPEKYKRDRKRYNINPTNGDRVVYKHHNRPELTLFGHRFQFEFKARDWQLRLLARCRFLRSSFFPHASEHRFRDDYEKWVDQLAFDSPREYERWLAILSTPQAVTGYRHVRYPKQDAARQRAQKLRTLEIGDVQFDPPTSPVQRAGQPQAVNVDMSLPILTSAHV